jgi:hypothetical protein
MSTGKEIHAKVEADHDKHDQGQNYVAARGADRWALDNFGARYLEKDEYDTIYAIKATIAQAPQPAAGPMQGQRTWEITDKEAKWHLDKVKQLELINFHNFLRDTYNIDASNPVMMKWAQEMFPDFWKMREEVIDDNAEIQKRLAKIRLMGPRDKDDFTLLFGIATGRVAVPMGALWDPQGQMQPGVPARGLFNPLFNVGRPAQAGLNDAGALITNRIALANPAPRTAVAGGQPAVNALYGNNNPLLYPGGGFRFGFQ